MRRSGFPKPGGRCNARLRSMRRPAFGRLASARPVVVDPLRSHEHLESGPSAVQRVFELERHKAAAGELTQPATISHLARGKTCHRNGCNTPGGVARHLSSIRLGVWSTAKPPLHWRAGKGVATQTLPNMRRRRQMLPAGSMTWRTVQYTDAIPGGRCLKRRCTQ